MLLGVHYWVYCGISFTIYCCVAAVVILAVVFGTRGIKNVRKERVTKLEDGFSPLDVQRIFIGKTYPRILTRALIVHWAELGYIKVAYVDNNRVKLIKQREIPRHNGDEAVFFDRGTFVHDRRLFYKIFGKAREKTVDVRRPLVSKSEWKKINGKYAVREDEGVYSSKHYTLKIVTTVLSLAPFFLSAVWLTVDGYGVMMLMPFLALLGFCVLRFMHEIPLPFRLVWCSLWLGAPIGIMAAFAGEAYDPMGITIAADIMMFLGSFGLIQFVDYREKNNLSDYSDLINYRKFLWRARAGDVDYYAALPFLYAFKIKPFTASRLRPAALPDWYISPNGERGGLL